MARTGFRGHQWAFLLAAQKQIAIDRWINGYVVSGTSPATFFAVL